MSYKISIVDASEVPDWERRPPKWADLTEQALALKPGQTMKLEFDDGQVGERARNAIRDMANLKAEQIVVRTRIVQKPKGGATVYIIRVHPE